MLLYVHDCICVSQHPQGPLDTLGKYFTLKPGSVGLPKLYLGAKMSKVQLPNSVNVWAISTIQYVQEPVKKVEAHLKKKGMALRKGTNSPLGSKYRPECDASPELNGIEGSYYASLIGILCWIVEMGLIDICCEVSMMSSFVMMPRKGHLQQLYHLFAFLKLHQNARLVLDPTYPDIDKSQFEKRDWKECYGEMKEAIPPNMPRALGLEILIRAFVDADYAGDPVSRRSRTGFIVMANMAPIYWLSRKQSCIEMSSFRSEFCAL